MGAGRGYQRLLGSASLILLSMTRGARRGGQRLELFPGARRVREQVKAGALVASDVQHTIMDAVIKPGGGHTEHSSDLGNGEKTGHVPGMGCV